MTHFKVPDRAVAIGGPLDGEVIELVRGKLRVPVRRPTKFVMNGFSYDGVVLPSGRAVFPESAVEIVEYLSEDIGTREWGLTLDDDSYDRPRHIWKIAYPSGMRIAALSKLDFLVSLLNVMAWFGGWVPKEESETKIVFERY